MDANKMRASTDCNESRNSKRNETDLYANIEDFLTALKRDREEYYEILKKSSQHTELIQKNYRTVQNKIIEYKKSSTTLSNELDTKCSSLTYSHSKRELSGSETISENVENYGGGNTGESFNHYLKPKANIKLGYRLILTKETFDRLVTTFQKLSGSITEQQKQVLIKELFALENEFEKNSNIFKQIIDNNLNFSLNHLNVATQMSQRVKYQLWRDTIDNWFVEIRKKRQSLFTGLNDKTVYAKNSPNDFSKQQIKISLTTTDLDLSDDILMSEAIPTPLSELSLDDSAKREPESPFLPVSCQICHEVLNGNQSLSKHVCTNHGTQICQVCGFIVGNVFNLEKHVNQSHKLFKVCSVCPKTCNSHDLCPHLARQINYRTVKKNCKKIHQCDVCLKYCKSQEHLKIHQMKHKTLYYRCDLCNKLSESRYEQNKHKSEHLTEQSKKFLCKLCYTHFETNDRLTNHIKQKHHMPVNQYPDKMFCVICYFEYDDPNQLIIHLKKDHVYDSLVIKSGDDKKKGPLSHQCRFCDIYCANLRMREVHVIITHGTAPYECMVCQATLLTKAQFDVHILKHTKQEEFRAGVKLKKRKRATT